MISSAEQLRAAAERLGATLEEVQELCRTRISLTSPESQCDSEFPANDLGSSLFQNDAINTALNESLFAICERAFSSATTSQRTAVSPGYSTSGSPARCSSIQDVGSRSPESASSSAAADQCQGRPRRRSGTLSVSHDSTQYLDDPTLHEVSDAKTQKNVQVEVDLHQQDIPNGSGKASCLQNGSASYSPPDPPSKAPPKEPLGSLISFALGHQGSFADVSEVDMNRPYAKTQSLSIIPGCHEYSQCGLFNYIEALFKAHLALIQGLANAHGGTVENIDELHSDIANPSWRIIFQDTVQERSVNEKHSDVCPPMIRKTIDLFQFTYRLIEKMSSADDSSTRGFLQGLYASQTPKLVASLTTKLLSIWAGVWCKERLFQTESLLLEWCIRLLVDFVVFELSPVSQIRHMGDLSPNSFFVFSLGKEGLPSLSVVIDYCFQFVSSKQTTSRECRVAFCELVQAYLIWCTTPAPVTGGQSVLWTDSGQTKQDLIDLLVGREPFWPIVVQSALQHVKKLPQLPDSCFQYSFLTSLVSNNAAKRALFQEKQDKSKWMLLNAMIRNIEMLNRDLLSCFAEAEDYRRLFPGIQTPIDFVHSLIASAAIQREILSADAVTKNRFLSSLELLILNSAKLVHCSLGIDDAMDFARKGPFSKISSAHFELCEEKSECEDCQPATKKGDEKLTAADLILARAQAVAFVAKVVGCLGKSVEDGSWDMSQMNTIRALLNARINSSRAWQRLWSHIYKLQQGLERNLGTNILLSMQERNSFVMVVEVVRKHTVCDSKFREMISPERENVIEPHVTTTIEISEDVKASFPPIWDIPQLQCAVCSAEGYTHFDDDYNVMMFMKDILIDRGQQILARYDTDSPFTIKWIRLQKRNAYIGGARELLDKSDRTVGQFCSCVPGYPKESGKGNESRVACSNDLCENRHMKIECVPGKCGSGTYCMNQRMQDLDYAKYKMVSFPGKGVGIVADEEISEGTLIGEYQGEVLAMDEYERRVQEYEGERHFYFMTLTSKLVIDASRKSQATRFLNHSCDPNAETQKWNADGEPRVGIFAKRAIAKGEEITFDYGARSLTQYSARCLCGSNSCRGFLTARKDIETVEEELHPAKKSQKPNVKEDEHIREIGFEDLQGNQRRVLEEEHRRSVVQGKIEAGQMYLRHAEMLSRRAKENPPLRPPHDLSDEMKQKLTIWKASLPPGGVPSFNIGSLHSQEEVRFPRIPRKTASSLRNEEITIGNTQVGALDQIDSLSRIIAARGTDMQAGTPNVQVATSNRKISSGSRWALFEETFAGKTGESQNSSKRPSDTDCVRRFSKVPRSGFLPTTSKVKKQPLRPKFANRKRKREQNQNDSMDEYSTASEAEPILEEDITSPSRLPDGSGACSDDEFVAAPPVAAVRMSSAVEQWGNSVRDLRKCAVGRRSSSEVERADEQARDYRNSRFRSSFGAERGKSDLKLSLHDRYGYTFHSPRTYDRSKRGRNEYRIDDGVHRTEPSMSFLEHTRCPGYRQERSPSKHRYIPRCSRNLEGGWEVNGSEDSANEGHHRKLRDSNSARPVGHMVGGYDFSTHYLENPELLDQSKGPDTMERTMQSQLSIYQHADDDEGRARATDGDLQRFVQKRGTAKAGRVSTKYDSMTRAVVDLNVNRRREDEGYNIHCERHANHCEAQLERSERSRFSNDTIPCGISNIDGIHPRDRRFSYAGGKKCPVPSGHINGKVDLRNIIRERSRSRKC